MLHAGCMSILWSAVMRCRRATVPGQSPATNHNCCLWYRVGPGESPVMYWAQDWVLGVLIVKTLYRCA